MKLHLFYTFLILFFLSVTGVVDSAYADDVKCVFCGSQYFCAETLAVKSAESREQIVKCAASTELKYSVYKKKPSDTYANASLKEYWGSVKEKLSKSQGDPSVLQIPFFYSDQVKNSGLVVIKKSDGSISRPSGLSSGLSSGGRESGSDSSSTGESAGSGGISAGSGSGSGPGSANGASGKKSLNGLRRPSSLETSGSGDNSGQSSAERKSVEYDTNSDLYRNERQQQRQNATVSVTATAGGKTESRSSSTGAVGFSVTEKGIVSHSLENQLVESKVVTHEEFKAIEKASAQTLAAQPPPKPYTPMSEDKSHALVTSARDLTRENGNRFVFVSPLDYPNGLPTKLSSSEKAALYNKMYSFSKAGEPCPDISASINNKDICLPVPTGGVCASQLREYYKQFCSVRFPNSSLDTCRDKAEEVYKTVNIATLDQKMQSYLLLRKLKNSPTMSGINICSLPDTLIKSKNKNMNKVLHDVCVDILKRKRHGEEKVLANLALIQESVDICLMQQNGNDKGMSAALSDLVVGSKIKTEDLLKKVKETINSEVNYSISTIKDSFNLADNESKSDCNQKQSLTVGEKISLIEKHIEQNKGIKNLRIFNGVGAEQVAEDLMHYNNVHMLQHKKALQDCLHNRSEIKSGLQLIKGGR